MRIAVFGATGGTGREVVRQALEQGHQVAALVRDPAKLTLEHPRLTIIAGNVLDAVPVERTVTGADAVVVSLGNTPNNPDKVVSQGTRQIVTAMQSQGIQRILVVTSLGVGDSKDQIPFFFKILTKTALRGVMADKEIQEEIVMQSGLNWTIVRPGGLVDGPPTGAYTAGLDKSIKAGQVSRGNVAAFVLQQIEDHRYLRATPSIT
jgi:putative NADH-flavin reductase